MGSYEVFWLRVADGLVLGSWQDDDPGAKHRADIESRTRRSAQRRWHGHSLACRSEGLNRRDTPKPRAAGREGRQRPLCASTAYARVRPRAACAWVPRTG